MQSAASWIRHIKQVGFRLRCSLLPLQGIPKRSAAQHLPPSLQAVFLSAMWHHVQQTVRCGSAGRVAVAISALQGRCKETLSSLVDCNSRPL